MPDQNSSDNEAKTSGSSQPSGSGVQHLGRIVTAPLRSSDANESVLYRAGGAAFALLGVVLITGTVLALSGKPDDNNQQTKQAAATTSQQPSTPASHGTTATASHTPSPSASSSSAHPAAATSHSEKPKPKPTSAPTSHKPPPKPAAPPVVKVPLTVLNNTTHKGLAEQAADEFRGRGWQVSSVGNYTKILSYTTVYFSHGNTEQERSAHELAQEFGKITRVEERPAGLPGAADTLVVVLTPNWIA